MNIDFSEKELSVIELIVPGKTAEEICNIVLHDWFAANVERVAKTLKTQDQVVDDIVAQVALKSNDIISL